MEVKKPTYKELLKKLEKAEETIAVLKGSGGDDASGEGDAFKNERDIALLYNSELKKAYVESEENFHNTFEACPLGIRVVTAEGDLIYANRAILDISGYKTLEELGAVPRAKFYTPESYAAHQLRKEKRKRGEYIPPEYEISIRRPDGAVRYLQVFRREITWNGERQFMAMYQDITTRLKAEQALRESEDRYRRIVEQALVGIGLSKGNQILFANEALLRMFNYDSLEELTKVPLMDIVAPSSREVISERMKMLARGEESPPEFEYDVLCKGGAVKSLLASVTHFSILGEVYTQTVFLDITNRKKAERGLLESQEMFIGSFHYSPSMNIITTYSNGHIVEVNDVACRVTGYRRKELIGKSTRDLNMWYDPEEREKLLKKLNEDGVLNDEEIRLRMKNGEIRLFNVYMAKLTLKSEPYLFASMMDITERKKAEAALRESEYKYRLVIEESKDAILLTVPDGRILAANPAACRMFGRSEEEICRIGRNGVIDITDPRLEKALKQREQTGEFSGELTFIRGDGTRFPGEMSTKIYLDKDGNKRTSMIVRDITDRKRAEEALKTLHSRQEAILAAVPDIIMEVDNNKIYTWTNHAGLEFFGDDVIGKEAAFYFEGEQPTYNVVQPLFNGSENVIYVESWQRRRDGEKRLLAWRCRVLKDEAGNVTGALSTAQDITARKQAETALRESEERYRTALNSMIEGCQIIGGTGVIYMSMISAQNKDGRKKKSYWVIL